MTNKQKVDHRDAVGCPWHLKTWWANTQPAHQEALPLDKHRDAVSGGAFSYAWQEFETSWKKGNNGNGTNRQKVVSRDAVDGALRYARHLKMCQI